MEYICKAGITSPSGNGLAYEYNDSVKSDAEWKSKGLSLTSKAAFVKSGLLVAASDKTKQAAMKASGKSVAPMPLADASLMPTGEKGTRIDPDASLLSQMPYAGNPNSSTGFDPKVLDSMDDKAIRAQVEASLPGVDASEFERSKCVDILSKNSDGGLREQTDRPLDSPEAPKT